MVDASGTSTYTYDPFGEMLSDENGASQTTSFAYDLLGNQTSVTYPLPSGASSWTSNDRVTYAYDPAGDMTGVTDLSGTTTNIVNTSTGQAQGLSLGSTGTPLSRPMTVFRTGFHQSGGRLRRFVAARVLVLA